MMSPATAFACMLLLLFGLRVLAICPPMCQCARSHRVVDCSGRNLSQLPDSLQHNIRVLNLSCNHLGDLDRLLSHFAHLRVLDVSHNRLPRMPVHLPRALWEIHASGNRLRLLDKNDTAYQWNLKVLDLSGNELERVVFINNTMPNLRSLNLSHNKFWTVPTNMPSNLETVDLSHNFLVQILPGSLDRLPQLAYFYLHNNRFSAVSENVFSQLAGLRLITLNANPWACEDEENITDLLSWMQHTPARVLGCPCYTRHVCGEAHQLPPTGAWHIASYTQSPMSGEARDHRWPSMQAVTSSSLSKWAPSNQPSNMSATNLSAVDPVVFKSAGIPLSSSGRGLSTGRAHRTSTTPSPSSKKTSGVIRSTNQGKPFGAAQMPALNLLLTAAVLALT
ncbi:OMGP protein, partial [Amia calva]|nr:OMGP protein [Amia calva]